MATVICPERKARREVADAGDLPQNDHTGVYCEFCETCRASMRYRRLFCLWNAEQIERRRERDRIRRRKRRRK